MVIYCIVIMQSSAMMLNTNFVKRHSLITKSFQIILLLCKDLSWKSGQLYPITPILSNLIQKCLKMGLYNTIYAMMKLEAEATRDLSITKGRHFYTRLG